MGKGALDAKTEFVRPHEFSAVEIAVAPRQSKIATQNGRRLRRSSRRSPRRASRFVPHSAAVLAILDYLLIGVSAAVVIGWIYRRLDFASGERAALVVMISVLMSMVFLYAAGCYRRDTAINPAAASSRLPVALGFSAVVSFLLMHYGLSLVFPTDVVLISISRCATFALIFAGIALCSAAVSRTIFNAMVRRRWFRRRVLIIGTGSRALHLSQLIDEAVGSVSNDLSFVSESAIGGCNEQMRDGLRERVISADCGSLNELARDLQVDEIVVAPDEFAGLSLEGLLSCKVNGIAVTDYHSFIERETGRIDLSWLELSWLVTANGFRVRFLDAALKRMLDAVASVLLMLICLPATLIAIVAIVIESRGPVLYRQERITQGGRSFMVLKLRTMYADAEKNGAQWAADNDPRITRVGYWLRRWRIDEIPQLWNILRGDMSFVGPRPERPVFVDQLAQEIELYRFRHCVRAGLTGWAQVNYRYGASVADARRKLEYDLYYIKNYSLLRDLQIILQTMRVLFWPVGVR